MEGSRWKVGDGESINVWRDPWLPSVFLPFVSSQATVGRENLRVRELIKRGTNEWNSLLLQQLFCARDIALIESIPLCSSKVNDTLIWPFTPSGSYIVKSGYRFLYKAQLMDNNDYMPEDNNGVWKRLWGLKTQPKVRNFLWRAVKDSIPTKINLKRRKVVLEDCCEQCTAEIEDTVHALWSCPLLSSVWEQQREWEFWEYEVFDTFRELVEFVVEKGLDLELFATTVWTIWHRRNALRTSQTPFPVQQVHQMVQTLRADFASSLLQRPTAQTNPGPPIPADRPPPWPNIKVNFDGACFHDQNTAGATAVIRDRDGLVLASMADRFPLPHSIVAVELVAAIKALRLAQELGYNLITLEGDSKIAIDAMRSGLPSLAVYGHLLEEVKFLVRDFAAVEFSFVPRQHNTLAHNIARHARHVSEYTVWMEDVPPLLSYVILASMAP